MSEPTIVTREEWLQRRLELLEKEKELTRLRDQVTQQRQQLPWVRIDKAYRFGGADGEQSLADLFEDKSQLLIYHFMLGPGWEAGCPSCSFWADNFDGIEVHLAHRDIRFLVVSRASYADIDAYRKRMGWHFDWVSSNESDFNFDFSVSFTAAQKADNAIDYNYRNTQYFIDELVGVSAFAKDAQGIVYHSYSTYSRGVDMLNGAYNYIDLTPKGRDEIGPNADMGWLKRHDEYDD